MEHVLIVIGTGLALAFIASKIFKKFGIPQVVGFMVAGILLRAVGVMTSEVIEPLTVIVTLALGLIGYNIGLELKIKVFRGKLKKLFFIVVFEATAAFWLVTLLTYAFTQQLHLSLLLGSVASATAPAATADVIWEHECRGPLSESLMFILAMDDVIAVILTNSAIAYALFVLVPGTEVITLLINPLIIILGSLLFGGLFGIVFVKFMKYETKRSVLVELELALIVLLVGVVDFLNMSDILAAVVFGFVVGNRVPEEKQQAPHMLEVIMSPIVMLFFVLVGAKTDLGIFISSLGGVVLFLVLIYLAGRTLGKILGTRLSAAIVNCETPVKKYLGTSLLSQAGVALGLGIIIETKFVALGGEAAIIGIIILNVVAISTIFLELIGPIAAKWSLCRAGEITTSDECVSLEVKKMKDDILTYKEKDS